MLTTSWEPPVMPRLYATFIWLVQIYTCRQLWHTPQLQPQHCTAAVDKPDRGNVPTCCLCEPLDVYVSIQDKIGLRVVHRSARINTGDLYTETCCAAVIGKVSQTRSLFVWSWRVYLLTDVDPLTESSNMGVTGNTVYEFWFCWFTTQPGNGSI